MQRWRFFFLFLAMPFGLGGIVGTFLSPSGAYSLCLLLASSFLAIGVGGLPRLAGLQYTLWILTAVLAGIQFPEYCLGAGVIDLRHPSIVLLVVQGVMFGMGTQMQISDFIDVLKNPRAVAVGLLCQFSIMPLMGYFLAKSFAFDPQIGAGIILIGACSSGLASNVMTYLAKANLTLSVTVTACATLLAPLMTPLLMKTLAGTMVDIDFWAMVSNIIKIVIFPIGAALLHDLLKSSSLAKSMIWRVFGFLSIIWLVLFNFGQVRVSVPFLSPTIMELVDLSVAAMLVGLAYHFAVSWRPSIQVIMPYISMLGIIYFTTVTTAAGRDSLLTIGLSLFAVAVIHNTTGYGLGYLLSRLLGLDKQSARAMALEVGLQNGGMASGIAGSMGLLGTLGLASAVFSPWMNISGSLLANYWKNKSPTSPP